MANAFNNIKQEVPICSATRFYVQKKTPFYVGTERYYGDRYLVLFNKDIDKAELIQKEDVFIDNVILMIFIVIVVLIFLLRKKIYLWLTKLEKKMNSFIIYQ